MSRSSRGAVQTAKDLVWDVWAPIRDGGSLGELQRSQAWQRCISDELQFHGPAPIGAHSTRADWQREWIDRLARCFPVVEQHAYLFLGGEFEGSTWVGETGEFRGVMEADFCGVPSTGKPERLRYGMFHRVVDGAVTEIRLLIDVLALASSAGFDLLPEFEARRELPPPPVLGNGLSRDEQDPAVSAETLQLVEDMLGGCNRLVDGELRSMGMDAYWHRDMCWWGPWGVGGTVGFDEFQRWAQGPSVASFPNRRGGFHQARIADGLTACFTGWPSLQGTFDGVAFRGIAPTGGPIGQNIMDFYVRRGELLHENWVLIDLVDFAAQCGVDLLADLPGDR